jgi:hypothetical protein
VPVIEELTDRIAVLSGLDESRASLTVPLLFRIALEYLPSDITREVFGRIPGAAALALSAPLPPLGTASEIEAMIGGALANQMRLDEPLIVLLAALRAGGLTLQQSRSISAAFLEFLVEKTGTETAGRLKEAVPGFTRLR